MHNKLTVINIYHNIHLPGSPATLTSSHATINQGKYSAGAASSCHCISGNSHSRGGKWHRRDCRNWGRLHISNCHPPSTPLRRQMWHSGFKMSSGCKDTGGVTSNVAGPPKSFWLLSCWRHFDIWEKLTWPKGVWEEPLPLPNSWGEKKKKKSFFQAHNTAFFCCWFGCVFSCHKLPVSTSGNFFLGTEVVTLCEGQHFPAEIAKVHCKTCCLSKRGIKAIATITNCDVSCTAAPITDTGWG